jgi:hypothetical protein
MQFYCASSSCSRCWNSWATSVCSEAASCGVCPLSVAPCLRLETCREGRVEVCLRRRRQALEVALCTVMCSPRNTLSVGKRKENALKEREDANCIYSLYLIQIACHLCVTHYRLIFDDVRLSPTVKTYCSCKMTYVRNTKFTNT